MYCDFDSDRDEMGENSRLVSESDFEELKNRLKLIFDADPEQFVNDFAIRSKFIVRSLV
jgi:hypothetical protein